MKIKGVANKSLLRAIESLRGPEALAAVRAALPPRHRETLDKVVAMEWYPVEASAALHVAVRDVLGGGKWDVSQELGREAARLDFTGPYKVLLRAVQYDTVWDRMERTWLAYADAGDAKWYERQPGYARAFISGVAGYNEGIWRSVAGRIEQLLVMSGAKGPQVSISEPTSTQCRFEAMWLE